MSELSEEQQEALKFYKDNLAAAWKVYQSNYARLSKAKPCKSGDQYASRLVEAAIEALVMLHCARIKKLVEAINQNDKKATQAFQKVWKRFKAIETELHGTPELGPANEEEGS